MLWCKRGYNSLRLAAMAAYGLGGVIFLRQNNAGDKALLSLLAFQLRLIVSISTSSPAALYKVVFFHTLRLQGWDVGLRGS